MSEKQHLVYKLLFNDNSFYIGVTNNLKRRLYEHKKNKDTSEFTNYIIILDNLTQEEAYNLEKKLVPDHSDRSILCRNKTRGGRHPFNMRLGRPHTLETREKISKSKKGHPLNYTEESLKIKSLRMQGDNNPSKRPEVREKLSRSSKENSARRGKPGTMLGKKQSNEVLEKISYKINTPFGIFVSSSEAGRILNISQQTVINRCNSKKKRYKEWFILSKGNSVLKRTTS